VRSSTNLERHVFLRRRGLHPEGKGKAFITREKGYSFLLPSGRRRPTEGGDGEGENKDPSFDEKRKVIPHRKKMNKECFDRRGKEKGNSRTEKRESHLRGGGRGGGTSFRGGQCEKGKEGAYFEEIERALFSEKERGRVVRKGWEGSITRAVLRRGGGVVLL